MKTLVGPWAEARKGRDNSLLGGGAGGGVQDGLKLELLRPTIRSQGQRLGRGGI